MRQVVMMSVLSGSMLLGVACTKKQESQTQLEVTSTGGQVGSYGAIVALTHTLHADWKGERRFMEVRFISGVDVGSNAYTTVQMPTNETLEEVTSHELIGWSFVPTQEPGRTAKDSLAIDGASVEIQCVKAGTGTYEVSVFDKHSDLLGEPDNRQAWASVTVTCTSDDTLDSTTSGSGPLCESDLDFALAVFGVSLIGDKRPLCSALNTNVDHEATVHSSDSVDSQPTARLRGSASHGSSRSWPGTPCLAFKSPARFIKIVQVHTRLSSSAPVESHSSEPRQGFTCPEVAPTPVSAPNRH